MSQPTTKLVIECQNCHTSLTIICTINEGDEAKAQDYMKHLEELMNHHIQLVKANNGPGKHHPLPPGVSSLVQDWIKKVRPA